MDLTIGDKNIADISLRAILTSLSCVSHLKTCSSLEATRVREFYCEMRLKLKKKSRVRPKRRTDSLIIQCVVIPKVRGLDGFHSQKAFCALSKLTRGNKPLRGSTKRITITILDRRSGQNAWAANECILFRVARVYAQHALVDMLVSIVKLRPVSRCQ